ncbi:berberine bridge enzyme-like 17 [Hibiscus syriacus]|uniref:berberine bridge enzyme-like 17 n=1 Tax=Hibiscus syriacus TaxID=106335 RepID=UPI001922BD9C|nr:berberine bridge enzyme-like 17 [Hibiscus syriacus]
MVVVAYFGRDELRGLFTVFLFHTKPLDLLLDGETIYPHHAVDRRLSKSNPNSVDDFLECLPKHFHKPSKPISDAIYTPSNTSFQFVYELHTSNLRALSQANATRKPVAIIAALHESHVQETVVCAQKSGLQVRIRSGGHDYEGLSFVSFSSVPFVIIDLSNIRSINIDMKTETAWVQAGATTGELYYRIAEKSKVHGFPAGVCTTLGIGGHFTGGGYGNLMRKFGLSIDNVVDAQLIDVKARIHNRKSMGEDVFWAIRGGGGTSFGVILSWKIKLVPVPAKVTVFQVQRTLEEGATDLAHKWLQVAYKLDKDLFTRITSVAIPATGNTNSTVRVIFIVHFLGKTDRLLKLLHASLPELGLQRKDCLEMSWIESTLFWFGFPNGTSIDVLLNRVPTGKVFSKSKSDYIKNVFPKEGLTTLWRMMMEIGSSWMQMNPYGGRMAEISESETAFAHRAGTLYKFQYTAFWSEGSSEATEKYLGLMTKLYAEMAPYVSSKPREAFLNYRDLDIGSNGTDFEVAKVYGAKYFKRNFQRLAEVKAKVDPHNFFNNEQSIPPFPSSKSK